MTFKDIRTITDVVYHSKDNPTVLIGKDLADWDMYGSCAIKSDIATYTTPAGVYKFIVTGYDRVSLDKHSILIEPHTEGLNKIDITEKVRSFLSKDTAIRQLGFPLVKQGWLLHGSAGVGKTHSINSCVTNLIGDNGVALYVQTDKIPLSGVIDWMGDHKPDANVDKLFVILEDLGGGESSDMNKRRVMESTSTILTFLDGTSIPEEWRHIPIVVFSTTNYPDLFLANLTDRPGRFDEVIAVPYPSGEGLIKYTENILKTELNDFDKSEIGKGEISVAHIRYAAMKYVIYNEPMHKTIKAMREYSEKIKKSWEKEKENE